jgi:hypothetical protein
MEHKVYEFLKIVLPLPYGCQTISSPFSSPTNPLSRKRKKLLVESRWEKNWTVESEKWAVESRQWKVRHEKERRKYIRKRTCAAQSAGARASLLIWAGARCYSCWRTRAE